MHRQSRACASQAEDLNAAEHGMQQAAEVGAAGGVVVLEAGAPRISGDAWDDALYRVEAPAELPIVCLTPGGSPKMLPASRKEVFDAWLDAARMREWMCPGAMTSSDVTLAPRVGGHFRIVTRGPEGQVVNTFIDSPALSEGAFGAATRKGRGPR